MKQEINWVMSQIIKLISLGLGFRSYNCLFQSQFLFFFLYIIFLRKLVLYGGKIKQEID